MKGQPLGDGVFCFDTTVTAPCPLCQSEILSVHVTVHIKDVEHLDVVIGSWEGGIDVRLEASGVVYSVFRQTCLRRSLHDPNEEDFAAWEGEIDAGE